MASDGNKNLPSHIVDESHGSNSTSVVDMVPALTFNDPFYLHPSDNPGNILVSNLFNGENYSTWRRAMSIALTAKNKIGFVDGTITKPAPSNSSFTSWTRCNTMVLSWLINAITRDLADTIIYSDIASGVWQELHDRFSQGNAAKIFQLRRTLINLQQNQLSVLSYFNRLKALWDELSSYTTLPTCSCGAMKLIADLHQQERLMQFLTGLNDSFAAMRTVVGRAQTVPTNTVRNPPRPNPNNSARQNRPRCRHCGKLGHTIDTCYGLHGYPTREANSSSSNPLDPTSGSLIDHDTHSANLAGKASTSSFFFNSLDCRYWSHRSYDLLSYCSQEVGVVFFAALQVREGLTPSGDRLRETISDRHTKRTIRVAKRHGGLYLLHPDAVAFSVSSSPSFDLWHWRLGHPSLQRLQFLARNFDAISFSNKCLCTVCPLAKQSRLPFPNSSISSSVPFQLLHCDIWGAFSIPSLSGAHYFLTIVDDFS
ncbi:uncharacterized protein LOC143878727 [Tasmannia lanceolata]|uniref:uncharacterized protein LOC143878727 n=1 Tax=Tasmannia lanceolata TaxID=3420 RepID=UPI0040643E15